MGRSCTLAKGQVDHIIAYGTVVSVGGPHVLIHTVPIGKDNWKVSIDGVVEDGYDEDLPVPIKNGPLTIADALGAIVAWPKDMVILASSEEKVDSPHKEEAAHALIDLTNAHEDPLELNQVGKKIKSGKKDDDVVRSKLKEIERSLPMACKFVYSHADRFMTNDTSLRVVLDEAMFGGKKIVWLSRNQIFDFMEMKAIGGMHILAYMGKLFNNLNAKNHPYSFFFVDPGCVDHALEKSVQEKHIIACLMASLRDCICLIPYNNGNHWILTVVNDDKNMVYLIDPLGNRTRLDGWKNTVISAVKTINASRGYNKAPGYKKITGNLKQELSSLHCGFCVLRYIKEIVESEDPQLEKMYPGSVKDQYYTQEQYDEVRNEWSEFVYTFVDGA